MIRVFISVFVVVLWLPAVGIAQQWDTQEKILAGAFIAGQFVNYGQAKWTLTEPGWHEINPIVDHIWDHGGTKGLVAWKVGSTALLLGLADLLPGWRKYILWFGNIGVWGMVTHDKIVGVGWRF
jgi:hypothetical protein